ncbi:hypothetical protein HHI36_014309 [Cryptolaemus montrouzieri]|uniref:Uncharacterized protein n=1 Tax=Cryptolaemus montrouzieri TaxID=559131 RepID=A0ABD2N2C5_9CUCU
MYPWIHGKNIPNKPNPLRVTSSNPIYAKEILKHKNKLASGAHKNMGVKDDKTPKQMDFLNKLRTELKRRIDNGEVGHTIKYIKGIPQIVENSTKNPIGLTSTGRLVTQT